MQKFLQWSLLYLESEQSCFFSPTRGPVDLSSTDAKLCYCLLVHMLYVRVLLWEAGQTLPKSSCGKLGKLCQSPLVGSWMNSILLITYQSSLVLRKLGDLCTIGHMTESSCRKLCKTLPESSCGKLGKLCQSPLVEAGQTLPESSCGSWMNSILLVTCQRCLCQRALLWNSKLGKLCNIGHMSESSSGKLGNLDYSLSS